MAEPAARARGGRAGGALATPSVLCPALLPWPDADTEAAREGVLGGAGHEGEETDAPEMLGVLEELEDIWRMSGWVLRRLKQGGYAEEGPGGFIGRLWRVPYEVGLCTGARVRATGSCVARAAVWGGGYDVNFT